VLEVREISDVLTIGILDLKAYSIKENIYVKREQEKAGTAYLLRKLLNTGSFELNYTPGNKPFLKNRPEYISISHSHDKLVISINKKEDTGIDIELLRDKVLKIRHKYLTEKEMKFAGTDIEKLITLWAAKEAIYKVYGLKGVDFRENLFIEAFEDKNITGTIQIIGTTKNYRLISDRINNYIMVYVAHEI
jgi:4'-phosphopantetheinyl transferase